MRLLVTLVSPATRQSTDIVLDADPATPISAVAAELDRFARGAWEPRSPARPSSGVSLYVDYQRIWQRLTLAEAPIRDGCVIGLGRPDGCVVSDPAGLVDGVVAGGLARGLPADLRPSPDGAGMDFRRPPRQPPTSLPPSSRPVDGFARPAAPPGADRSSLSLLMAALPLVVGLALALLLHQVYLLAMAAVSPLLLIAGALGRWLVAQAAILHGPNDLRIYLLTDASGRAGWEWVRWLPHCRPGPGGSCVAQLGNDAESVTARMAELLAIIAARRVHDGHRGAGPGAGIVVVLDGWRRLRSLPGISRLLGEGPQVGVYVICLERTERLLPAECQSVAVLGRDGLRVRQTMADTVGGVRADAADPSWCTRVARSLAPIRDVGEDGGLRPFVAAGGHWPTPPAPVTPATSASPATLASRPSRPTEVWLASVDWAALGRPAPVPPAARERAEAARRPCGDALANARITF